MTIDYSAALSAIRLGSSSGLRAAFEPLTLAEMVELGTFIGPHRLRAVVVSQPTATTFRPRGEPLDTTVVLAEINRQAFNVAPALQRPLAPDPRLATEVRAALLDVAQRRRAAPLLTMPNDVTGTLPTPASIPPPLGDADYAGAAARQNVEVASIKAVASVESSGRGFDEQGRPKILFEATLSASTRPTATTARTRTFRCRRGYGARAAASTAGTSMSGCARRWCSTSTLRLRRPRGANFRCWDQITMAGTTSAHSSPQCLFPKEITCAPSKPIATTIT